MRKKTDNAITVDDVRRWRKAAFEDVLKQSLTQRAAAESKFIQELGLKPHVKPKTSKRRKAS